MLDARQPELPLELGAPATPVLPRARRRQAPRTGPVQGRGDDGASEPARGACAAAELTALRRTFLGLAAQWALSGPEALELLGEPRAGEAEREARLRALVGLGRSLGRLEPRPEGAAQLLRQADPAWGGASPLQVLLAGDSATLQQVRAALAARAARGI